MEFFVLGSVVLNVQDAIDALRARKPFMNVDASEFYFLHLVIMTAKCFIAGYGVREVLHKYVTLFVGAAYSFCMLNLYGFSYVTVHCISNILAHYCTIEYDVLHFLINALIWQVSSLNIDFQICLDIYVLLTVVTYIFQIYDEDYEKGCAMVVYLYLSNYLADYYIGEDKVNVLQAVATVHIPVIALLVLRPPNVKHNFAFFSIAILASVLLSLKLLKIAYVNGIMEDSGIPHVKVSLSNISELICLKNFMEISTTYTKFFI